MTDPTEYVRAFKIMSGETFRDLAKARTEGERTWTTEEMTRDFEVVGFAAPYVVVRRKADGVTGTLEFTHSPRVYFGWKED